jgi:acyl-coenzyme A synthetase/AMP-(fatty) acid ligase
MGVLLPLYVGAPLVLAPADPEGFARAIERCQPGHAVAAFETVSAATRDAKKAVKSARGTLEAMLLTTGGLFDPGERQRIGRAFECPALTLFGLPETGLLFASHPSWYLDESVGIPVTNAHVVPADPRTGVPIQALWELVESAEVTAAGPALMEGYADGEHPERFAGRRFRTRLLASQDANGMIYLLPPEDRA